MKLLLCCLLFFSFDHAPDFLKIKSLPVQHEGRVKPLDTLARNSLLLLRGKQSLTWEEKQLSPIECLLDIMILSDKADQYPLFRVDHPDILALIHQNPDEAQFFALADLRVYFEVLRGQASKVLGVPAGDRDAYQEAVLSLWTKIDYYLRLQNTLFIEGEGFQEKDLVAIDQLQKAKELSPQQLEIKKWLLARYEYMDSAAVFSILPPLDPESQEWSTIGHSLKSALEGGELHPAILSYGRFVNAYRQHDTLAISYFIDDLHTKTPVHLVQKEVLFNQVEPFYLSIILYILAFLCTIISWVKWELPCRRLCLILLVSALSLHSFGLVMRMWIEGRPPVTNLYSSAVFVGWGAVFLSLFLEKIYKNGFGFLSASALGSITLVVAHHLAGEGDTMEMMRAVLNSNFWLSTHVVTITIGYSTTLLAGFIALSFILKESVTSVVDSRSQRSVASMVYAVICFSTLFSFVGTVLGGIWADQSWGRFWGWDPKENGALILVLWNVLILHARWGKMIRIPGLMMLAVGGNIVTSFSWFGVNMLGVGLHSYGFMNGAFTTLALFMFSQVLFILLAATPRFRRRFS